MNSNEPGQPAASEQPEGWVQVHAEGVCEINPRKPESDALPADAPVAFVPMAAVDEYSGSITGSEDRPFSEIRPKSYTPFAEGDVLFAKITPCMENGKAAVATGLINRMGFGSTEFHVFRPTKAIISEYLYHYVRQKSFRDDAQAHMTGTAGQLRVPADYVKKFQIPLPPLAEQRRIVEKVGELLERVNGARARLAKLPAILKGFRQSVLAAACSGRLTAGWREENCIVSQPQVDGELPITWEIIALRELCEGFEYGSAQKSDEKGEVPVLRMGNLQNGEIDWSNLKYSSDPLEIAKYSLARNTVLFNRTNSPELVGKTAIYRGEQPAIFAGYLIRILSGPRLDPEFLNYCLNDHNFREYCMQVKSDGVSQSNINAKKLANYKIPLPPMDEQREIVRRVKNLFAMADGVEDHVWAATLRAERLPQAILARAFRGELVLTEAELAAKEGRDYEPASILLERIQKAASQQEPRSKRPRRTTRKKAAMEKIDKTSVLEVIETMPRESFAFDELRAKLPGDYDALKDILFGLLDDPRSGVVQVFDEQAKAMRFRRRSEP